MRGGGRRGPDIVLAGSARSGTTYLAARLCAHPLIDGGAVKEPNYFSRRLSEGADWYDGLYERDDGLLRLDASVSYTYPQYANAIDWLVAAAPEAVCVYVVRDPLERAVSHFHYNRSYFKNEPAPTFASALDRDSWYLDVSDYGRWIDLIVRRFGAGRTLIVPFAVVGDEPGAVTTEICRLLGIEPAPEPVADDADPAALHRNTVVEHRSELVRRGVRALRRSRAYPVVRKVVGADRTRVIRDALVRKPALQTVEEALRDCRREQRERLEEFSQRTREAVAATLGRQDDATGLDWSSAWRR